nr:BLUF domain-containing protein [Amylibacter sp.]
MHYLIYQSTALIPRKSKEHDSILISSYRCNKRDDITGFLHREPDNFIQYIEGPLPQIEALMVRLTDDWRHKDLTVLHRGEIKRRRLPDWQMGFVEQGTLALSHMIRLENGQLSIRSVDPFDLVDLMVANAELLRQLSGEAS